MANLIPRLQEVAMENQPKTAIAGDDPMTFSTLWSQTDAFAGGLKANDITAGDHVAIRLSNPRAFLIAFYGTLRNGCIPVTVPTEFSADDVVVALEETGGKAYVTDETPFLAILHHADDVRLAITVDCDGGMGMDLSRFLDNDGINSAGSRTGIDIVSRSDSERGLVAYGRHSEGDPLGVVYSRSALLAAARTGQTIAASDGPIHHLGSLSLSNPIELLYGATAALLSGGQYGAIFTGSRHYPRTSWDAGTASSLLETGSATRTFVTPEQQTTLRTPAVEDGKAVVVAEPAADPIVPQSAESIRILGCPETGLTHVRTPDDGIAATTETSEDGTAATTDPLPVGETAPNVETRILDGKELAVAGPAVMDEYIDRPALTTELIEPIDGKRWVRTGVTVTEGGAVNPIDDSPLALLGRSHS